MYLRNVVALAALIALARPAMAKQDLATLSVAAHQLKRAAGGNRFPAITEAAKELETGAEARADLNELRRQFDALADLCLQACPRAAAGQACSPDPNE